MRKWEKPELMILGIEKTKNIYDKDIDECPKCDCDYDEELEIDDCDWQGKCTCHNFEGLVS